MEKQKRHPKGKQYILKVTDTLQRNGHSCEVVATTQFSRANRKLRQMVSDFMDSAWYGVYSESRAFSVTKDPLTIDTCKWQVKSKTNGKEITFEIYVKDPSAEPICSTCFHANWDCKACRLGHREITDRSQFKCCEWLPMGEDGQLWMNGLREECGIRVPLPLSGNMRPMNGGDLREVIKLREREERLFSAKAYKGTETETNVKEC